MVEICALASGSNGNSYYIGNDTSAVLIDAGIYYKMLSKRLDEAGLDENKIKAIFISHDHADHVQGLKVSTEKLKVPAVLTKQTYFNLSVRWKPWNYIFFEPDIPYTIDNIIIHPFIKKHDASQPCSFRVELENINVGVFTDIGEADQTFNEQFTKCNVVFLESNYDDEMLWKGNYPYKLKQRVSSGYGHLSNKQALEIVKNCASPNLKTIFLSHISAQNNTPELAFDNFKSLAKRYEIKLAKRSGISDVLRI